MTGLSVKFTCGVLVLLCGDMGVSQAPAHEIGDFGHYIPGLTMGVPVAAVPEPDFTFKTPPFTTLTSSERGRTNSLQPRPC
jgi:hypothetical protein